MSMKLHQNDAEANRHGVINDVDDLLIEKVWRDLDGQLSREQVGRVVAEVSLGYQDAKVKAFLPILIHRQAVERLKEFLLDDQGQHGDVPVAHAIINS
ncbi:MAG: hypothetical protein H6662_13920 [Ardenticatenaceae bacterium]|nr:hypothetical protein [Ardenticatenaceae bacterium]MCB8991774.1 hypothetical protein [Ardenticatenaceae bacterium]MCB9003613.1 hypothetical protein [Ardenticatenaceae bacterium]